MCCYEMPVVISRDCKGINHDTGNWPNFNLTIRRFFRKLGRSKVGLMIMNGFRLIMRPTLRSDCSYLVIVTLCISQLKLGFGHHC